MRYSKLLYLSLFSLMLSSCAYYEKIFEKESTAFMPKHEVSTNYIVQELWSVDSGDGRSPKSTVLQPAFDNKKNIYIIDSDGLITSVDSQTGNKNWSQDMDLDVTSGISTHKDLIFFGTSDGKIYCLSREVLNESDNLFSITNIPFISDSLPVKPKWHFQLKSESIAPAVGSYNNIFVKTNDGDTLAIDITDGSLSWKNISGNIPLSLRGSGSASVDFENIYVARDDGTLVSLLQQSGKLNWYISISAKSGRNELESLRDVEMSPYIDSGIIFVGSYQGNLIAVDSISGSLLWSVPISIVSNLDGDDDKLFASSTDGYLFALNKYNGDSIWKTKLLEKGNLLQPVVLDDTVVVMSDQGYISLLDKSNGKILKYEKITDEIDYQIRVLKSNKSFFILEKSGRLTAFNVIERKYEESSFFSW